ncbi:zwei Ig domain protein zig-8-like [Planococcus citri]|uniref:zwei Ig domain protein zig-8-like n=1 Tax=Planococcus citri TaxID=170843 RepID=UPI0031F83E1E
MEIRRGFFYIFLYVVIFNGYYCEIINYVTITSNTLSEENVTPATLMTFELQDPYFDTTSSRNVTVIVGKSAYLPCKVKRLGGKSVSWIRHRDLHILTVGKYLFTTDERFQALHKDGSDEWILFIKYAQIRDSGIYECQISTQPVRSIFVNLNVVEPVAEISGAPEIFVSQSSNIFLTCTIKYSPEPPSFIRWYHNERIINYDSPRGGVNVITEKGDITISYLIIQKSQITDSGRFYCCPSNARKASVMVHVVQADSPAAMQKSSTSFQNPSIHMFMTICSLLFISLR